MLKMTVRLEDKAGETVGQFNLELPMVVSKPGISLMAVAAAEAFVQGQGKSLEYAKELTIEIEVTHASQNDEVVKMLQDILEQATVALEPAASEKTN